MSANDPATAQTLDEHRRYVFDSVRLNQYAAALAKTIQPGAVVVDLGAGTGILGLLALRLGAGKVYAMDSTGMLEVCRALARAHGFEDRFAFLKGHSRDVVLPERADVVVCDQLAPFGFEAGLLECFADAKQRMLKPGGQLLPQALGLVLVPVASERAYASVVCWERPVRGLNLRPVRGWAANCLAWERLQPEDLLGAPQRAGSWDLASSLPATLELNAAWTVEREGLMHGLAGWFEAALAEGITLTNNPLAAERLDREQALLPLDEPLRVAAGDRLACQVSIRHEQRLVVWQVRCEHTNGTATTRRQSTLQGLLLGKDDLRKTLPDFRPVLADKGAAMRSVLELCDGRHTRQEIEAEVLRRHGADFRSPQQLEVFLTACLSRFTV